MTIILLLIDPQIDFHDDTSLLQPSLPVPGSSEDTKRIIEMIRRHGDEIDEIYVTLDSHHVRDVVNRHYFTRITHELTTYK
jgi:cephalosporin hydroxylase